MTPDKESTTQENKKENKDASQNEWWEVPTMQRGAGDDAAKKKWDLVYPISMVVYLVMGFGWGLWHPGWLVFTAAWAFEEIMDAAKLNKRPIEFYGLASVVFFIMGFGFDLWRFAWIVYVVAFFIEGVSTSYKDM